MDEQTREFMTRHYAASEWLGGPSTSGALTSFILTGLEIQGWTMVRGRRKEGDRPPSFESLWSRGNAEGELISIRAVECADSATAREQLLEELSNFQSPAIQRRSGPDAPGDVAFGLGETMVVFSRANLVFTVRNAGRSVVPVTPIARSLDAFILRRLNQ